MTVYHLAQINIARARDTIDSATMKGFVERIDEINALADEFPGFVWRLQTEEGDATSLQPFDDPGIIVNMSVWEDLESLKRFVYRSTHVDLVRDREAWFSKMMEAYQALWWVPAGHLPTLQEGKEKLEYIQERGPGEEAFTFARHFAPPQS